MEANSTKQQYRKKVITVDELESGMVFAGFLGVPDQFKELKEKHVNFLKKYHFIDLKITRNGIESFISSAELEFGDRLSELGRLKKYLKINDAEKTKKYFNMYGFQYMRVLVPLPVEEKPIVSEEKPPASTPIHLRTSGKLTKNEIKTELNSLQENIASSTKVVEKGSDILINLFHSGNFQNFKLDSLEEVAKDINQTLVKNPQSYNALSLLKDHDEYTFRHCVDVANQMLMTLKFMKHGDDTFLKEVAVGALLHDIGKSKVPLEIINKPGKLTEEEWEHMRMHPVYSAEIMKKMKLSKMQIQIGYNHHVRKNGTGYPPDVEYENTSMIDRIASIADVYQALVTKRPYKVTDTPIQAFKKIKQWTETDFDEKLVEIFIKAFGIFPPGSMVKLNDETHAFVIIRGKNSLRPVVAIVIDKDGRKKEQPEIIDLEDEQYGELKILQGANHRNYFKEEEAFEVFMRLV